VPEIGGGVTLPPPHPANSAKLPARAAAAAIRRARGNSNVVKIPAIRMSANASDATIQGGCLSGRRFLGGMGVANAPATGWAVVVTVRVVPDMEQLPAGIEHVAVNVGVVLKPLSLN
jgi:hypothetical protein